MSLILEALKKSEARRRLGEAPDLDTPFAAKRRRRSPLPFIVVAIVIAGAAGWWLSRAPTSEKVAPAAPTQAQSAASKPVADRIMKAADSRPSQRNTAAPPDTIVTTERSGNSPFIAVPPAPPGGFKKPARLTAGADTTVVTAPAPVIGLKKPEPPAPAVALKPVAVPAPTVGLKKPELPVTVAPIPEVKTAPPATTTDKAADATIASNAANAKKVAAPAPPALASTDAQPYYELPFSVRKDLPTIKLSMHVYAPEPALRFIILNDSRMGEGDSQDELALREIRPDGAVFEFHGKRFFFPRDGL